MLFHGRPFAAMRIFTAAFCACAIGCGVEPATPRQGANSDETAAASSDDGNIGWPTDAAGLLDHLNDWFPDELEAYNEPENFPNRKPSGETGGWIHAHKEKLAELGVEVEWDRARKKYVFAKAN